MSYTDTTTTGPSVYLPIDTSTEPQRQPQVAEAFDVLEKSLEALVGNCAELEQRLDGVLRHEPEAAGSAGKEATPTVVALAQRLNDNSDKIHRLNNQLGSVLRRLEV
jgi:hypothetical protein